MDYTLTHQPLPTGQAASWLWGDYLGKHTWRILLATFFVTVQGSLLGLLSYLIGPMFDNVLLNGSRDALVWLGLAVFGIFCLRGFAGFFHRIIMEWVGERVKLQLQDNLMRHILTLDAMFFEVNPPGNLISRVLNDSAAIKALWANFISPLARDVLAIISLLVVLISIDWIWTLVTCAGIPLLVGPILLVQKHVRRYSMTQMTAVADTTIRLDEIFHGIHAIKLNIQEQ
ncbi:MAG: ABC transporter transmembrane domain-containing protein, partial [Rhodobacteraceae bacterium]|nr:ABC transporter transmembrane domain-containing protein [Paracoccaceae bacterium]